MQKNCYLNEQMQCHLLLRMLLEEEMYAENSKWTKNAQGIEHFLSIAIFMFTLGNVTIPHREYALELFNEANAPERVFIRAVLFEKFGGIQAFEGFMELDGEVTVSGNEMQVEEECVLGGYPRI